MATVGEPATKREDGNLETGAAQEPVLHGGEIRGLRHRDRGTDRGQLGVCTGIEKKRGEERRGEGVRAGARIWPRPASLSRDPLKYWPGCGAHPRSKLSSRRWALATYALPGLDL